jgi:glycosyltransferase involved in cell wall biosynthesis
MPPFHFEDTSKSDLPNTLLVSVVMPNYNKGGYVRDAIESVLAQTYTNFELIIVDDGSNDESPEVIEEFSKSDFRVVYRKQSHHGVSAARNVGIDEARGDLIAFLDSDDVYHKEKLRKQVESFRNGKKFVSYTNGWEMDAVKRLTATVFSADFGRIPDDGANGYIFQNLLRGDYITGMTVMMPSECLRAQRFDPKITVGEDWDLWVRLSRSIPFRYIPEALYGYRVYAGNTTRQATYELANLNSQVVMYEKWLSLFDDLQYSDQVVIVRSLWKCYMGLRKKRALLRLALRYRVATLLLVSRIRASLSYRLKLRS